MVWSLKGPSAFEESPPIATAKPWASCSLSEPDDPSTIPSRPQWQRPSRGEGLPPSRAVTHSTKAETVLVDPPMPNRCYQLRDALKPPWVASLYFVDRCLRLALEFSSRLILLKSYTCKVKINGSERNQSKPTSNRLYQRYFFAPFSLGHGAL